MGAKRTLSLMVLAAVIPFSGAARAQEDISIRIDKHAQLSSGGGIVFTVHVVCGPLPGVEDFREGFAGAVQQKTGAEAEGELSPSVLCDGVERVYTGAISPITDAVFVRGPAGATAAVIACNIVGDQQICIQSAAHRRVIISGR